MCYFRSTEGDELRLAGPCVVRRAELDTSCFVGNAPGWARLRGRDARADAGGEPVWFDLLGRERLQPDTRHRFRLATGTEVTHVRLDVYPDGGMARVRLPGALSQAGRDALAARWFDLLPTDEARRMLLDEVGCSAADAEAVLGSRPVGRSGQLPEPVRALLDG